MKNQRLLFCFLLIMSFIPVSPGQKFPWKLVKSGEGIWIYSRPVEGSEIHEFKGLTVLNVRMEVMGQIFRDITNYPRWMAFCKKGTIIKRFNENNMIVHIIFDLPVVADRDMVVKEFTIYDLSRARANVNISLMENSNLPVPENTVRMPEFAGSYQCEFITREKTGLIFYYRANPGGKIPSFLSKMVSEQIIYDSLRNLKNKMIHDDRYIAAAKGSNDRVLLEGIFNNREKCRSIIKTRMKEYYRDCRSIDKLLVHDEVVDEFLRGKAARLTEIVFFSLGSRGRLIEAAQGALELILLTVTKNDKYLYTIPRETALINRLIDGPGQGEKCVYDIVIERVRDSLKDEFKNRQ